MKKRGGYVQVKKTRKESCLAPFTALSCGKSHRPLLPCPPRSHTNARSTPAMYLMYTLDANGKRVYTLKVRERAREREREGEAQKRMVGLAAGAAPAAGVLRPRDRREHLLPG